MVIENFEFQLEFGLHVHHSSYVFNDFQDSLTMLLTGKWQKGLIYYDNKCAALNTRDNKGTKSQRPLMDSSLNRIY